ncbi:MAG: amidohydrolase [Planctomycetaceae bacterium]|nr:amidohydrolase [Planctomycetaceae bacterium]
MPVSPTTQTEVVERCKKVMAHAWMVRTFIKHSEEAEDFPELMGIVRGVFDTARALDSRGDDPAGYLHMLRKKISKLRKATEQFRTDALNASAHMNFEQSVISIEACVEELEYLLSLASDLPTPTDAS